MDFAAQYIADNKAIEARYALYRVPAINPYIKEIVSTLAVDNHVKKAIIAIDSSMRYADDVTADNKDTAVLTTDLLSALFYRYMAESYDSEQFKLLTQAVKDQNRWKSIFQSTHDESLIARIETAFIAPFINEENDNVKALIEHSKLNQRRAGV